jgi:hypothetical protein
MSAIMEEKRKDPGTRERRRAARYYFGGAAEVTNLESGKYAVCKVTNLSRTGCFIKTAQPFEAGAQVQLQITHNRRRLQLPGKVVNAQPSEGMAIAFGTLSHDGELVLETWLAEVAARQTHGDF